MYILKWQTKKTEYICPECKKDLIVCKGSIKAHHFRHKVSNQIPCHYYTDPTESQIHKDAKILLKTILDTKISVSICRECPSCNEYIEFKIPEINDKSVIKLEYRFDYNGKKIADVAYIDNDKLLYIFEIYNTHKTKNENRPEPWFEIDAKKLIQIANNTNSDGLIIPCIRSEKCEDCLNLEYLKKTKPAMYVRTKLGQNYQKPEYDNDGRVKHRRFDLSCYYCNGKTGCKNNCIGGKGPWSCNAMKYQNNQEICDLFNNDEDMGPYSIVLYTWKGIAQIYVVPKEFYEEFDYWDNKYWHDGINGRLKLPYRRKLKNEYYGGTVKALIYLLDYADKYLKGNK